MSDPRLAQLAELLADYSLAIKPGELMRIRGSSVTEPLAREIYRLAVQRGAHPFLDLLPDGIREIMLRDAPEAALDYVSPIDRFVIDHIDIDLVLSGEHNAYELAGVDPARIARHRQARRANIERWQERADGPLRWCVSLMPNNSSAQNAGLSLRDYEAFVYHAMKLDQPDPVAAWREQARLQEGYCAYLEGKSELRIVAEDTDLTMSVAGRHWVSADGKVNFPDGEVFTGPVEASVKGHIRYSFPTIYSGRGADDVRLWFDGGEVVRWEAREGKTLLDEMFALDDGARRLGEVAIGTNYDVPTFSKDILFDEKIGGTCHLAVGSGYPVTGNANKSVLHWDMICDLRRGGEISADGEVFHRDGQWLI